MKRKTYRSRLTLVAVMVMLMATLLTACGSSKAADTSATEDTTNVEVTKEAEPAETTEAEEVAEVEPAVAEPTPEPVVYEGIDMESTLPGLEWIQTFDGIIDEPKVVIFNDETNRKLIVENGQEIEFSDTDILLIYVPTKLEVYMESGQNDYEIFDEIESEKNYGTFKKLSVIVHDGDRVPLKYEFSGDGNDYTLTVTLIAKKSE